MSFLSRAGTATPPRDLGELFLRDVTSLLVASRTVIRSLSVLRAESGFPPELSARLEAMITVSRAGESLLREPMSATGIVLPAGPESAAGGLVTRIFSRWPARALPSVLEAEILGQLRLLAQHLELKAQLASETAWLIGQPALCRALFEWADAWRTCGDHLGATDGRLPVRASCARGVAVPVARSV